MISVNKIFGSLSGNSGLTEELIYSNILEKDYKYEVLSSSVKEQTKLGFIPLIEINNKEISIFKDKIGILIARKGNAGYMTLLDDKGSYTINEDAYIIYLLDDFIKKEKKDELKFLKWFISKHQNTVKYYSNNTDNATWNKTTFFKECLIELPTKRELEAYSTLYDNKNKTLNFISEFKNSIQLIANKNIVTNSDEISEIKVEKILSYISRNDMLSEEGLYNIKKNKSNNIKVLSGSIDNIYYGEIPKETEKIHSLKDKQGLHLITRGKAGKLTFLEKGHYATNTNAFILYLKDEIKNELNIKNDLDEEQYLKFLKIYLQPIFFEISSNSDVSVFPLTKVFAEMEIPKFIFNSEIKEIVEKFNSINEMVIKIDKLQEKMNKLLEKEII